MQRHIIINVDAFSCKMKLEFSATDFRKFLKHQISLKSIQREPKCFMRADRQTDLTKLIVAFYIL